MSLASLLVSAGIIKNETALRANTASRIGSMFEDVINFFNKSYVGIYDNASVQTTVTQDVWTILKDDGFTTSYSNNGLTVEFAPETDSSKIVNTNSDTKVFKVDAVLSVSSGNNNEIHFAFYKNGVIVPCSEQSVVTSSSGRATAIPIQCLVELAQNQYIQVYVKNATSSTAVTKEKINIILDQK